MKTHVCKVFGWVAAALCLKVPHGALKHQCFVDRMMLFFLVSWEKQEAVHTLCNIQGKSASVFRSGLKFNLESREVWQRS